MTRLMRRPIRSWKAGQVLSRGLRWRRAQARYSPCTARLKMPSTVAATGWRTRQRSSPALTSIR